MLLPWLTFFDLRCTFTNFLPCKKLDYKQKYEDFVILIPIFNDAKYLSNINFLKKYKEKVVLCTTDLESGKFYKDLYKIARKNGFRILKTEFDKGNKNPWKIYQKTLLAHDYVLGEAVEILNAKYVIFLDADTTCKSDISTLVGQMEKNSYDLASFRVVPSKKKTITENLQYIEYSMAMKSRKVYPWLTSGAAMIGKRKSLKKIMKKHSMFFNGGDIEIGKIANLTGMKVGYIPATFYTDVPETYPKLVKQRFSWFCGAFRHSIINVHTNLASPIYALYFTLIIFLMLPLKIYELFIHWYILPFLFLFYIFLTFITNWEIRSKYMFLFPFYSLSQVLIFPFLGIGRYVETVIKTKNWGFIKVYYKKNYHPLKYVFNALIIGGITFVLFNIHFVEGQLMLNNVDLFSYLGVSFQSGSIYLILYNGFKLFFVLSGAFFFLIGVFKGIIFVKKNMKKIKFKEEIVRVFFPFFVVSL